jgi:hypothetical protein
MSESESPFNQAGMSNPDEKHDKITEEVDTGAEFEQMELKAILELANQNAVGQNAQSEHHFSDSPGYDDEAYDALSIVIETSLNFSEVFIRRVDDTTLANSVPTIAVVNTTFATFKRDPQGTYPH